MRIRVRARARSRVNTIAWRITADETIRTWLGLGLGLGLGLALGLGLGLGLGSRPGELVRLRAAAQLCAASQG